MRCRHNFRYSQGGFRCSKCGKWSKERTYKRSSKKYPLILTIIAIIIAAIVIYTNFDVATSQISDIVPVQKIYPSVEVNMDLKPRDGVKADFTIESYRIENTEYYDILYVNVNMVMKNMELEDAVVFSPSMQTILKNENGKQYPEKCHGRQLGMSWIKGDETQNQSYNVCYHVEKTFDKFDVYIDDARPTVSKKIGTIVLD